MPTDSSLPEYGSDTESDKDYLERQENRDRGSMLPFDTPYSWPAWPAAGMWEDRDEGSEEYRAREGVDSTPAEDDTWMENGVITLLVVAGVVLFVFPEPVTSGLGIVLMAAGAIAWLIDSAL